MGEVLLAQFVTQLLLIISQIAIVLLVAFPLFRNPMVGQVLPFVLLCVSQGICGMWYGKHLPPPPLFTWSVLGEKAAIIR